MSTSALSFSPSVKDLLPLIMPYKDWVSCYSYLPDERVLQEPLEVRGYLDAACYKPNQNEHHRQEKKPVNIIGLPINLGDPGKMSTHSLCFGESPGTGK